MSAESFYTKLEILQQYDTLAEHDKSDVIRHLAYQFREDLPGQYRSPDVEEKLRTALVDILTYI